MKAILIGDSIRQGYQPLVAEQLAGAVEVWGPAENGGTSANVLAHLEEWVLRREADLVHLNCGLHDLAVEKNGSHRVEPEDYRANLRRIFDRLKNETGTRLVWAATTPVLDARHHTTKPFDRFEADVQTYNAIALELAAGLEVNDLHAVIVRGGVAECLGTDGVHMTAMGYALLAGAVAAKIREVLGICRP
jgi:lysophospholipase L1-like esterase